MGSGSAAARVQVAVDQRVSTSASRIFNRASRTASSNGLSPPAGSVTYRLMSCSWHTASWIRLSTSGLAMAPGTGVTRPTHCDDSHGESVRTGTMTRRLRCAMWAYRGIIALKVSTSGPPMPNDRFTSPGTLAQPTR